MMEQTTQFENRALERLSKEELIADVIWLRNALVAEHDRRVASDRERGGLLVEVQVLRSQ